MTKEQAQQRVAELTIEEAKAWETLQQQRAKFEELTLPWNALYRKRQELETFINLCDAE